MTARSSMADLISRLRLMTGAVGAAAATFDDEEVQDFLDERRTDIVQGALRCSPEIVDGALVFRIFTAGRPWWESDEVLTDPAGAVLNGEDADLSAEPLRGRWTFDDSISQGTAYITGRYFDMYGAAVSVLSAWQARVAREYDTELGEGRFLASQQTRGLAALANEYRRRSSR